MSFLFKAVKDEASAILKTDTNAKVSRQSRSANPPPAAPPIHHIPPLPKDFPNDDNGDTLRRLWIDLDNAFAPNDLNVYQQSHTLDEAVIAFYNALCTTYHHNNNDILAAMHYYANTAHPNFILVGIMRQMKYIISNIDAGN
jgi:hypothetical protein